MGVLARLQSTLARLGPIDVTCTVVSTYRSRAEGAPASYTCHFRRPDGRCHRVQATDREVTFHVRGYTLRHLQDAEEAK